ncbi:FAD-binding oxidoreductase [Streptomyces sp. NPDC052023]|uniref:FAD-binding oxidoreductase n=1 Tax=Streptomyces sp. NPDC052023 TaxID=3365681 RepID=UPI0037D870DC
MPADAAPDTLPHPSVASVTGWGRTAPTTARVIRPRTYQEAVDAVRGCGARGGIPRGLGRAYGDAAQNAGGTVLGMTGLARIHAIDAAGGTVLCDAGVSLHHLAQVLLPLGWFVPVTPGTGHVTVGGAIGADVHGRNHPTAGSFTRHVPSLELLTADGEICSVGQGTPLFDATAGGMGLTGVVLTATLRLQPVQTAWMTVDTERAGDLDDLLARMTATGRRRPYSVAWIDLLARGAATGRGVLTRAEHAPPEALRVGTRARRTPLAPRPTLPPAAPSLAALDLVAPDLVPEGLMSHRTVGLFNELWFRAAPRARTGRLRRASAFFHPLDGVPQWNRIYGRGGFVHYQFVVGDGQEDALCRIVRRTAARRFPSLVAVLKRFGDASAGWLSFPVPGWTLALDIPAGLPGLAAFLDGLDEEVAAAGGRVCLAEDSRLRPDLLTAMYPKLADFRALRAELDPRGVFASDLSRRLGL